MKKNKKGFTLVELIVVVALMVIIMGAVLSILRPVNNFYQKVNNTTHQEAACIAMGDSISDNIKYAKKVKITCSDTNPVPSGYKNYILIDNQSKRTGANGIAKECQGVIKQKIGGGAEKYLRTFDENNNASYEISVEQYGAGEGKNFIKLNFKAMAMKYESGSYVKNTENVYQYSKSIEFTNINNKQILSIKNDCNFSYMPYSGANSYPNYILIEYDNPDD